MPSFSDWFFRVRPEPTTSAEGVSPPITKAQIHQAINTWRQQAYSLLEADPQFQCQFQDALAEYAQRELLRRQNEREPRRIGDLRGQHVSAFIFVDVGEGEVPSISTRRTNMDRWRLDRSTDFASGISTGQTIAGQRIFYLVTPLCITRNTSATVWTVTCRARGGEAFDVEFAVAGSTLLTLHAMRAAIRRSAREAVAPVWDTVRRRYGYNQGLDEYVLLAGERTTYPALLAEVDPHVEEDERTGAVPPAPISRLRAPDFDAAVRAYEAQPEEIRRRTLGP